MWPILLLRGKSRHCTYTYSHTLALIAYTGMSVLRFLAFDIANFAVVAVVVVVAIHLLSYHVHCVLVSPSVQQDLVEVVDSSRGSLEGCGVVDGGATLLRKNKWSKI